MYVKPISTLLACLSLVLLGACSPALTAVPASSRGTIRSRASDGVEMMFVPAGEFPMGSPDADPKWYDAAYYQ